MAFSLGLHLELKPEHRISFLLSELRKRAFAAIYSTDKDAATLLGRPPRINRRYCVCQLPLDISDEDLDAEAHKIPSVLNKLDVNGWNTDGILKRATWIRIKMLMSVVREDILDLALSPITSKTREVTEYGFHTLMVTKLS